MSATPLTTSSLFPQPPCFLSSSLLSQPCRRENIMSILQMKILRQGKLGVGGLANVYVKNLWMWLHIRGHSGTFPACSRVWVGCRIISDPPREMNHRIKERCQHLILSAEFCLQRPMYSEPKAGLIMSKWQSEMWKMKSN